MKKIKVKIKTWAKLEEEFGIAVDDCIDCPLTFTSTMEESMPSDRIIITREIDNNMLWIPTDIDDDDAWQISNEMIEQVLSE